MVIHRLLSEIHPGMDRNGVIAVAHIVQPAFQVTVEHDRELFRL
jgi:hypothetical protein